MPLAIGALENVKLYQRIVDEGIEIYKRHSYLKSKQQFKLIPSSDCLRYPSKFHRHNPLPPL